MEIKSADNLPIIDWNNKDEVRRYLVGLSIDTGGCLPLVEFFATLFEKTKTEPVSQNRLELK